MPQDTASLPVRPLTSVMTTSTRVKPVKTSPNGVGSPRVTNHTKNGNDRRKAPIKKPLPNGNNNTSNSLRVGVWRLQSNEFTEFAPPEKTESLFNGQSSESVIGGDGRKVVPKKHLMPGGKYRGTWASTSAHSGSLYILLCRGCSFWSELLTINSYCKTIPTLCRSARGFCMGNGNGMAH